MLKTLKDKSLKYQFILFSVLLIIFGAFFTLFSVAFENFVLYKEINKIYEVSLKKSIEEKTKDIVLSLELINEEINSKLLSDLNIFKFLLKEHKVYLSNKTISWPILNLRDKRKYKILLKEPYIDNVSLYKYQNFHVHIPLIDDVFSYTKDNVFLFLKLSENNDFLLITSNVKDKYHKRLSGILIPDDILNVFFLKVDPTNNFYTISLDEKKFYGLLYHLNNSPFYIFLGIPDKKFLQKKELLNLFRFNEKGKFFIISLDPDLKHWHYIKSTGNFTKEDKEFINRVLKYDLIFKEVGIFKDKNSFYLYVYYKPFNWLIISKINKEDVVNLKGIYEKRLKIIIYISLVLIIFSIILGILISILFSSKLNKPIELLNHAANKLSQGDTSIYLSIKEDEFLSTELRDLGRSLKETATNLNFVISEIKNALNKLKNGDFNIHINLGNTQGIYRDILFSLDDIIKTLRRVIFEIKCISNEISKGNLNVSINTSKFKGEYKEIFNLLEKIIKNLSTQISQAENIIKQSKEIQSFRNLIENDSVEEIYNRIFYLLKNSFNVKEFALYEVDNENNKISVLISSLDTTPCSKEIFHNANLCRAKQTGEIVISNEKWGPVCKMFRLKDKYHLCKPIFMGQGVKYILLLLASSKEELENLKNILRDIMKYFDTILPILETKKLVQSFKEKSLKDQLTGLYNRRFLDEYLEKIVPLAKRRNSKIGFLMIDVDFFKEINDKYGHDIGDEVLKQVSNAIISSIRDSDVCIRFGGEEFLVVLNDIENEEKLLEVAERIRSKVEAIKIQTPQGTLRRTVSIGASLYPDDSPNIWQVIKFADVALYEAKRSGRNRIVKFKKDMWKEEGY